MELDGHQGEIREATEIDGAGSSFANHRGVSELPGRELDLRPTEPPWQRRRLLQVVDKLQSRNKSKRESWRTELPNVGLSRATIHELEDARNKDVAWQGECSGIVYI